MRIDNCTKFYTESSFWFSLGLLFFVMPYFVWNLPFLSLIRLALTCLLVIIAFKNRKNINTKDRSSIVLFVFTTVYYIMLAFFHGTLNVFGIISQSVYVFFFSIVFLDVRFLLKVFKYFSNIYAVLIGVSLVCWFLAIGGLLPSTGTIRHYNEMIDRTYSTYPFVVIEYFLDDGMRFSGLFDEPGVVGTTSALLLCLSRFQMKNWRTYVLILSGVFSMSFFFYALTTVYWPFYLIFSKRKYIQALLLCSFFAIFFLKTQDNDFISDRMWSRFEWNATEGKFAGDNRMTEDGERYIEKIKGTHEYYFGVDNISEFWKAAGESSSYKNIIAMYGIIFFVLYCAFFVKLGKDNCNTRSSFVLYLLLFSVNMYQRVDLYSLPIMFLYSYLARRDSIFISNPISQRR